jgi:hypothetical protein
VSKPLRRGRLCRREVTDIKDEKQPMPAPADADLVMADEELDRIFGGMTGTYVCATQLQSSVVQ